MTTARRTGTTLALASSVGFALQAIWAMYAYEAGVEPVALLVLRFAVASACFWAIVAWRRPVWPSRHVVLAALGLGLVPFAIESCAFFLALQHVDAGLAELLFYTYPGIVVAAAVLLRRETASRRRVGALTVSSIGIALVLVGGTAVHPDPTGIALALLAAVAYAAFVLLAEGILHRVDPFLLAALIFTGAGISLTAFGGATGQLHLDVSAAGWLQVVLLATISTVGAETAFLVALRHVGAGGAAILSSFEPVVAAALAWILFGQALGPVQVAGGVLVVLAIVVLATPGDSVADDEPAPAAAPPAAARPREADPACGARVGVRAEVGRLQGDRLRRRRRRGAAV